LETHINEQMTLLEDNYPIAEARSKTQTLSLVAMLMHHFGRDPLTSLAKE
jgi:hypothetical protein